MTHYLTRQIEMRLDLDPDDRALLDELLNSSKTVGAKQSLVREGDKQHVVTVVQSGLFYRYKVLEDGRRQIVAYMIPGDFCNLYAFLLNSVDYSAVALVDSTVLEIAPAKLDELTANPRLRKAFWCLTVIQEAIARQWIANLGRRSAEERIAHFLCEMMYRLGAVGLFKDGCFHLPLSQTDIADTLGLSLVHTNKSIQKLRAKGLLEYARHELKLSEFDPLARFSSFDPSYLHILRADASWSYHTALPPLPTYEQQTAFSPGIGSAP